MQDATAREARGEPWWRSAVVYQVYPRSFADSDGDGIGDLPGLRARLDHLAHLGVDALWLSPMYVSPLADGGYDVADYRAVDARLGTLADVEGLVADAHARGLRVLLDLVPNHTSVEHAWFVEALASVPGSPARARYLFRDGRGEAGEQPPNGWRSVFGGPAWTRTTDADGRPGQWYLHLFDPAQPDLDWTSPEVREEFHDVLRFWLDRGVDGFRVDVAHALVKAEGLPEWDAEQRLLGDVEAGGPAATGDAPMWDQEGVHEIYRGWRGVVDAYDGDRVLVAEAWVEPPERLARYLRPDEMHLAFAFAFLESPWRAGDLAAAVADASATTAAVGAPVTWLLSNHDVVRHRTRLALPEGTPRPNGIRATDPQPDQELGLRRAHAAVALMLALPGSAFLYQGEELGLPEHTTLPEEVRQDPVVARTLGQEAGRDGCRVPLPWDSSAPALGFSPSGSLWLPQPEGFAELAVDRQEGVPGSTLELYRTLLRLRGSLGLGRGRLLEVGADGRELRVRVGLPDGGEVLVVVVVDSGRTGAPGLPLPAGAELLVATEPLDGEARLPADAALWAVSAPPIPSDSCHSRLMCASSPVQV